MFGFLGPLPHLCSIDCVNFTWSPYNAAKIYAIYVDQTYCCCKVVRTMWQLYLYYLCSVYNATHYLMSNIFFNFSFIQWNFAGYWCHRQECYRGGKCTLLHVGLIRVILNHFIIELVEIWGIPPQAWPMTPDAFASFFSDCLIKYI